MLVSHLNSEDLNETEDNKMVDFFRNSKSNYMLVSTDSPLIEEI